MSLCCYELIHEIKSPRKDSTKLVPLNLNDSTVIFVQVFNISKIKKLKFLSELNRHIKVDEVSPFATLFKKMSFDKKPLIYCNCLFIFLLTK